MIAIIYNNLNNNVLTNKKETDFKNLINQNAIYVKQNKIYK